MASWLRWWGGTCNDPKLALVAREAGQSRATVVAVWASVLELANAGEERGVADDLPADEIGIILDLDAADVEAILGVMRGRGMIDGLAVTAWAKRQPDREREDDDAADRKRRQRERERHTMSRHVTPCHTMSRRVTPPEAEAEAEAEAEENHGVAMYDPAVAGSPTPAEGDQPDQGEAAPDNCPHEQIVEAYQELLPHAPRVRVWGPSNRAQLRARWRESAERRTLAWWRVYFEQVAESDFLCGRSAPSAGRAPFVADLAWLVRAQNLEKVLNGRFCNREHDSLSAQGRATAQAGERWEKRMAERLNEGGTDAG